MIEKKRFLFQEEKLFGSFCSEVVFSLTLILNNEYGNSSMLETENNGKYQQVTALITEVQENLQITMI